MELELELELEMEVQGLSGCLAVCNSRRGGAWAESGLVLRGSRLGFLGPRGRRGFVLRFEGRPFPSPLHSAAPWCGLCGELASPHQRIRAPVTVLPAVTGSLSSLMFGL